MADFKKLLTTGSKLAAGVQQGAGQYTGKLTTGIAGLVDSAGADEFGAEIAKGGFSLGSIRDAVYGATGIKQTSTDKTNPLGILNQGAQSLGLKPSKSPYTGTTPYEIFMFPADLNETYSIALEFCQYKRHKISQPKDETPRFRIVLPLPEKMVDAMGFEYKEVALGTFIKPAAELAGEMNAVYNTNGRGEKGAAAVMDALVAMAKTKGGATAAALGQGALRKLVGLNETLGGNFDRFMGDILNPNMSVAFSGVALRKHAWEWQLIPRNPAEAKMIRTIIRRIKQAAHPANGSDFFLDYPHYVQISIGVMPFGEPLWKFKPAFLTEFSVSHPVNSFHNDQSPVAYSLSMSFSEMEIFTADDFTDDKGPGE